MLIYKYMIKKTKEIKNIDMIFCDNCGQGISINDKKVVKKFIKEHKKCKFPKNDNLEFLNDKKEYV